MSQNRITRWADRNNYRLCFKITYSYYNKREQGKSYFSIFFSLFFLIIKRFFFIFFNLFRFNKKIFLPYIKILIKPRSLTKAIIGLYKLHIPNLLEQRSLDFIITNSITFKKCEDPLVSIVVPVFNQIRFTYNCLASIKNNVSEKVSYEIIIIDDCSTDETNILENYEGIRYIKNKSNLGFLKSCNKASSIAKGKFLCFLNNDTQVQSNWLESMVATFKDERVGLVGSQLLYPYGLLQEAGGLVNHRGEPANYGRNSDRNLWQYNFLREADYCSGASILLLKSDFEKLNGFDTQFAPAYYEDTDLCFSIRYKLNKRVIYQPLSKVVHFEGVTSGKKLKKGSVKEYQLTNSYKFLNKWETVYKNFPVLATQNEQAEKFEGKRIFFIDSYLPRYDKDSGSRRIFEILNILSKSDYSLWFFPDNGDKSEPYFSQLTMQGIKCAYTLFQKQGIVAELHKYIGRAKCVWISRPELNQVYHKLVRENKDVKWINDTVDLHFLRKDREAAFSSVEIEKSKYVSSKSKEVELQLAREADLTIAITEKEGALLESLGVKNVTIIPNIHTSYAGGITPFSNRNGICFIGSYYHTPNVDAAIWLIEEIMPLVWKVNPSIRVNLLGSDPNDKIRGLESEKVSVPGFIEDVSSYFNSSKVFVAPLRFGAGMKGKIGHSMEYGLPVVTTDIGAEGMDLEHEKTVLIGNSKEEITEAILSLYANENQWNYLSSNSISYIRRFSPEAVKEKIFNALNTC